MAFPTGCSKNHIAAHWTPNGGCESVIDKDDVIKFDLGVQVKGTTSSIMMSPRRLTICTIRC